MPDAPPTPVRRLRGLELVAPALLLVVAAAQVRLTLVSHFSPWKGGGFGMFSTLDSPAVRRLSIECISPRGEPCVVHVPVALYGGDAAFAIDSDRVRRQLVAPDREELAAIARDLLEAEVVPTPWARVQHKLGRSERVLALRRPDASKSDFPRLRAVRIGVWRPRFDRREAKLRLEPIVEPVAAGEWP